MVLPTSLQENKVNLLKLCNYGALCAEEEGKNTPHIIQSLSCIWNGKILKLFANTRQKRVDSGDIDEEERNAVVWNR